MKKILLIGAGVIGLIVLVGAILLYFNRDKIASYAMDRALNKVEGQVLQNLPDHKAADTVKSDFAALHERLQSGTMKAEDIKELAAMFYNSYQDEKLDSIEVHQLVAQVHTLVNSK
jgi:hypothetical protein